MRRRQPISSRTDTPLPYTTRYRSVVDRKGVDVADAAAGQVAGAGMVHGMGAAPGVVGSQRQHADRAADPVVGEAVGEEGAVAAIVRSEERRGGKEGASTCSSRWGADTTKNNTQNIAKTTKLKN